RGERPRPATPAELWSMVPSRRERAMARRRCDSDGERIQQARFFEGTRPCRNRSGRVGLYRSSRPADGPLFRRRSMNGFSKWITIAALAVAPAAFAQGTGTMDELKQRSVDVALAAIPVQAQDQQQLDDLREEIDRLRSEVNAQQEREDRRQELLGDPDAHP